MPAKLSLSIALLCLVLVILSVSLFSPNAAEIGATTSEDVKKDRLQADYWNWWINLPADKSPEQSSAANQCTVQKSDSVIMLLDPFQMGKITQACDIPSGSSVLFPFYNGWCDNGIKGFYNEQSFEKILGCALDADRGIVTMKAILDGKTIIDLEVDNKDVHNPKVIRNNLPQSPYYEKITSHNFFNLTVTNKTQFDLYEKPQDFQLSPYTYKAAADCFCGFLTNAELAPGAHQLTYITSVKGSEGADDPKGWNYDSDITYHLNVTE